VHDERFYREDAVGWSSHRGLRPVTWDEYQHRRILEPFQLMALAMRDGRAGATDEDRARLHELSAVVDAADADAQRERLQVTNNEAIALYDAKAWRTMARMFDVVMPAVDQIAQLAAATHDRDTSQLAGWAGWYYAHALTIVGRTDDAMARTKDGYARFDASWPDAEKLRQNWINVVIDRLCALIDKKDYAGALRVYGDYKEPCRAEKVCAGDVAIVYVDQSVDAQNAGDWPSARAALQQCVAELPDDARCRDGLADLESRHKF